MYVTLLTGTVSCLIDPYIIFLFATGLGWGSAGSCLIAGRHRRHGAVVCHKQTPLDGAAKLGRINRPAEPVFLT